MKYDLPPWTNPNDPALLQAIEHQRWLNEQLQFLVGFWDTGEPAQNLTSICRENQQAIDAAAFAKEVYLAMDWPTFPDVRCL